MGHLNSLTLFIQNGDDGNPQNMCMCLGCSNISSMSKVLYQIQGALRKKWRLSFSCLEQAPKPIRLQCGLGSAKPIRLQCRLGSATQWSHLPSSHLLWVSPFSVSCFYYIALGSGIVSLMRWTFALANLGPFLYIPFASLSLTLFASFRNLTSPGRIRLSKCFSPLRHWQSSAVTHPPKGEGEAAERKQKASST